MTGKREAQACGRLPVEDNPRVSLSQILTDYGYWAVFAGSLLEGETILVLAGWAAFQGFLSLPLTVGIAFAGGTLGDQIFFWMGRFGGKPLLARLPHCAARVDRLNALLIRFDAPLIIGIRFIYGVRILGPIVIGSSPITPWRFAAFNIIGAAIWAPLIAGVGFLFGRSIEQLIPQMNELQTIGILAIICVGVAFALGRR